MATIILHANKDVSVSEQYDKIYTGSKMLCVGGHTGDRYYALINFENFLSLTGAKAGDKNITSAKLTVTKIQGQNAKGENIGYAHSFNAVAQRLISSWSDTSGDWSSKPKAATDDQSAAVSMGSGHSGSVTFDVTNIVQAWADGSTQYGIQIISNEDTVKRLKTLADETSSSKAYITITFESKTTSVTAPTSIYANKPVFAPNDTMTISWSGATAGVNNAISSYKVYWKIGGAPTTSSYTGKKDVTSASTSINLSNAARGSKIYIGVITYGTASGYNSGMKTASVATVNTLPGAPSVTSNVSYLKHGGGTVTFTVSAGSTGDSGQSATLYYATSNGGTKTKFTSPLKPNITSSSTYYFYTYDGLEYSSATTKTIPVYNNPAAPSVNITAGNQILTSSGGNVTFSISAGKVNYGSASIYYSTSINGIKTACSTSLAKEVTSTTTYYFYTKDGLDQYSDYTSRTISVNEKPNIIEIDDSPTIIDPSTTSQSVPLARDLKLSSSISKTDSTYEWWVAAASTKAEVNTLIKNNSTSDLIKIFPSSAGSVNISEDIEKGHYYQVGLRVKDSLEYSDFKWTNAMRQNPLIPNVNIDSIISTDEKVPDYEVPVQQYGENLCLTTTQIPSGEGYPKITILPKYKMVNGNLTGYFDNYEENGVSPIVFNVTFSPGPGNQAYFGILCKESDDTSYEYFKEEIWTQASLPYFPPNYSIKLSNGKEDAPIKPYSNPNFSFVHTAAVNAAEYEYRIYINNKIITPILSNSSTSQTTITRELLDWAAFNSDVGHTDDARLNSEYTATLKICPKNVFKQGIETIATTVYFNYKEKPIINDFRVLKLETPLLNCLYYKSDSGFGGSNSLQFQNGDALTFIVNATDINKDLKTISLYRNDVWIEDYDYTTNDEDIYITHYFDDKINTDSEEAIFHVCAVDRSGNISDKSEKVSLIQTNINSPSANFYIENIEDGNNYSKITFQITNMNLGDSIIDGYSNLKRYGLTESSTEKKILTLKYLDSNGNWQIFGSEVLDDYSKTFGFNLINNSLIDALFGRKAEIVRLQFELKVLYDLKGEEKKYTIFDSPVYLFYFEMPTVAHRKNHVGLNVQKITQEDAVLVIKSHKDRKKVYLIESTSDDGLEIVGAILNCGSWD